MRRGCADDPIGGAVQHEPEQGGADPIAGKADGAAIHVGAQRSQHCQEGTAGNRHGHPAQQTGRRAVQRRNEDGGAAHAFSYSGHDDARSPFAEWRTRSPAREIPASGTRPDPPIRLHIIMEPVMSLRLALAALFLTLSAPAAEAQSGQAGFERRTTADGIEVGVWYPAAGSPIHQRFGLSSQDVVPGAALPSGRHPLIVMSHGTGGDFAGHVDTAVALARAGFIVAALTHPGDNWRDNNHATRIEERPAALSAMISYMLQVWPGHAAIDSDRIGAFGFSAGGFTVLAAAGGRPDLTRLASHCAQHPDFFDCGLIKAQPRGVAVPWTDLRDARIKAVAIAAPALGFAFDRAGLAQVRVPIQLWRADDDHILPAPFYADAVRASLPNEPEFHAVPAAGHFDFLAPCADPASMPQICRSAPGFDRAAFHTSFDAAVVRFFSAKLVKQ